METEKETNVQTDFKETKEKSTNISQKKGNSNVGKAIKWLKQAKIINKKTIKFFIILVAILFVTNPSLIPFLPDNLKMNMTYALGYFLGDVTQISKIIPLNWITFFQIMVMIFFLALVMEILKAVFGNIHPKNKRVRTLITLFLSTTRYSFTIIGIIWGLKILGVNTGTIFASVGIVSLIIGFSAENLISDVITGLFLIFDNPYNVGDIIEVGNFRGTVKRIGIRTTGIEDAGNNIKIINNSDMRNIINRSSDVSKAVCDIVVPVNNDLFIIEEVMEVVLKKICEMYSDVFAGEPKYLGIQSLEKDSMVIRVTAPVEEQNIYDAQRILNRVIRITLGKKGVWGDSK